MDIQGTLYAWGRGRAIGEAPNGYKTLSWARMIRNSGQATHAAPPLDEELHLQVDKLVSDLRHHNERWHDIICLRYLGKRVKIEGGPDIYVPQKDGQIAKELKCGRTTVREIGGKAEARLEAQLEVIQWYWR